MRVTTIAIGFTKNLGNYQSERIDLTADISEEDNLDTCVRNLRILCRSYLSANPDIEEIKGGDAKRQSQIQF